MAKKMGGVYKNTNNSKKNEKYMISEDMSAPSLMPRGVKSIKMPYVECGGLMMNDSVAKSDRDQNKRASDLRRESPDYQF